MEYIFDRKSSASTIALHGIEKNKVKIKELFAFVEKWMVDNGFEPNRMSGKGPKHISFERGKKALEKEDFEYAKNKGFWIASLPPDEYVHTEAIDYLVCGYLSSLHERNKENLFMLSWDENYLRCENSYTLDLFKKLEGFLKPKYGYTFQRSFSLSPIYYLSGTIFGLGFDKIEERKQLINWNWSGILDGHLSQPYFIRDVYRLNFLSRVHLDAPVGKSTLENWIKENETRGTLEKITSTMWCWSVDEDQIDKIRQELIPHKILAAFMDY